jgi:hypothetical protein
MSGDLLQVRPVGARRLVRATDAHLTRIAFRFHLGDSSVESAAGGVLGDR